MNKKVLYFILLVGAVCEIFGCASDKAFIVPTNSEFLKIALEKEKISQKGIVPFAVNAEPNESHLELSASGLGGGMLGKRIFVVQPSVMINQVINAVTETTVGAKPSFTLSLKLTKYNYTRLEYGWGTSQPAVWLTVNAFLLDHGRTVSEGDYISRAQCGPPFSTSGFWQSRSEAPTGYAIATYQALIVAIEQAINQKSKPIDQLRDPHCISYTKNDTWDLDNRK